MTTIPPLVTIGVPVHQGEPYIDDALCSIREQTFGDFELIVSDNASTDNTESICREHEAQDDRITYYRSEVNKGASWNYGRLFALARGRYFKWAAHDDVIRPDFLRACADRLDDDPTTVVAHTGVARIDAMGDEIEILPPNYNATGPDPVGRFRDMLLQDPYCAPVFGLMRREVLRRTGLLGPYNGHDRSLLAELALLGRFAHVPEILFLNREHAARSVRAYRNSREKIGWFDPSLEGKVAYRHARLVLEYHRAIGRSAPRMSVAARCEALVGWWAIRNSRKLTVEALSGAGIMLRRASWRRGNSHVSR